ncbi:MAG: PIN domain-containing protein [Nitrososphaerota archaeon]|nr:PIN domain-containing protein [Nitrososphaerota archaeon]
MLFETRYFWAVFTSKNDETTGKLKALFDKAKVAYASSITVYEIYKQTLANDDKIVARLRAGAIARDFEIIDVNSEIAENGAEISHRLRIPMADSLIMATAKRFNLSCVTDDPHYTEVKRVWV